MKRLRLMLVDYVGEIDAPVETVFGAYKDVETWPQWLRGVDASGRDWRQWRVGRRLWFRFARFPLNAHIRVFAYEENARIAWGLGRPGSPGGAVVRRFDFTSLPGGRTSVRHREWAEGPYIVVTWPFRPFVARFTWNWAADLKRYCEHRKS